MTHYTISITREAAAMIAEKNQYQAKIVELSHCQHEPINAAATFPTCMPSGLSAPNGAFHALNDARLFYRTLAWTYGFDGIAGCMTIWRHAADAVEPVK
jgi:hypothetical protein